jgi:hypothetical protein
MTDPKGILSAGEDDASLVKRSNTPCDHSHPSGANLPPLEVDECVFDRLIALRVREALPVRIAPEPVLRGLL